MKKKLTLKLGAILVLFFVGFGYANAQFLENTETVDIVQIPGFDGDGGIAQFYVSDTGSAIEWSTETGDATKWYKIPAGGVSNGTDDVQAYYYKNVETGNYLYISDETMGELAGNDGDWPTKKAEATAVNGKTDAFKWFDRPSNPDWGWAMNLANAAGTNLNKREGNRYTCLTGIILMKVNDDHGVVNPNSEFFGVHVPNVSVGGFAGGMGNAWAALKKPVVAEAGVPNPDIPHFLSNVEKINIVQIPAFDGDGKAQRYLADVDDVVTFSLDQTIDASKWYKIPAGGVSNGTEDVQAYYYKNVATGKYLGIDEATLAQLISERGGDWPTEPAASYTKNDKSLGFKWFDRPSNWPWGIFLSNAAGIDLTARENNQIFSLTSITIMKNEGEEFFGVYFPHAAVGGFAGGGGNAWTAVKIPVVLDADVLNPDYFPENPAKVDIVQIPAFDGDGKAQRYLADVDDVVTFSLDQAADASKWYKIPAGGVSNGTEDVQAYYYKNVATGKYLGINDATLAQLISERGGDWPTEPAASYTTNDHSLGFKWFDRPSPWGWGIFLSNAAGIDLTARENNQIFSLTSITIMKNEGEEFFGVYFPHAAVGGFAGGGGNAWTAVKIPVVADANVKNPDYKGTGELPDEILPIDHDYDLGSGWGSTYDSVTHTITFNGEWQGRGWWFGDRDLSGFKYAVAEFEPVDFKVQGIVEYNTEPQTDSRTMAEAGAKRVVVELNEATKEIVKQFYLQASTAGQVVLNKAYLTNTDPRKPDLIVTDITWNPASPVVTDSILFSAVIKNIGDAATPDVKHGVTFAVKAPGSTANPTVVAWSDTHLTSLAAGASVTVTANGGPKGDAKWKFGRAGTYIVVAEVNDGGMIIESDRSNNKLEKEIVVGAENAIKEVAVNGKVYTADGRLYFINFPENAVVSIYNLQAQKIGDFKLSEVSNRTFPSNLYIVKVQVDGKASSFKVLIK